MTIINNSQNMLIVKFIKAWNVYRAGEIAGFDEAKSKALIEKGFAVAHGPDVATEGQKLKAAAATKKQPTPSNRAMKVEETENKLEEKEDDKAKQEKPKRPKKKGRGRSKKK